jgi:excisionase family DNA binding protein
MNKFNIDDYMTVKEAAEVLGFHEVSVRRLVGEGKLESRVEGTTRWIRRSSVKEYKVK